MHPVPASTSGGGLPNGPLFLTVVGIVGVVLLLLLAMALEVVKQYQEGVLFRLGRVVGIRALRIIIPLIDGMHRVSLHIVTMPIQSQGIITRDTADSTDREIAQDSTHDPVFLLGPASR